MWRIHCSFGRVKRDAELHGCCIMSHIINGSCWSDHPVAVIEDWILYSYPLNTHHEHSLHLSLLCDDVEMLFLLCCMQRRILVCTTSTMPKMTTFTAWQSFCFSARAAYKSVKHVLMMLLSEEPLSGDHKCYPLNHWLCYWIVRIIMIRKKGFCYYL